MGGVIVYSVNCSLLAEQQLQDVFMYTIECLCAYYFKREPVQTAG